MGDLFGGDPEGVEGVAPLADRMRPGDLDGFRGQEELTGP